MHAPILLLLYLGLTLAPLLLAHSLSLPSRSFWDELATAMGFTALAILLVEFVLSGRFRIISSGIGMDVTMRFHQLLARTAAALIFAHPLFYISPEVFEARHDTPRFSVMAGAAIAGIAAWLFILISAFRNYFGFSYEAWRRVHGTGALVVAVLAILHAVHAGRYSAEGALLWYWLMLLAVASASLVWVYAGRGARQSE